ncbi:hypothetical protein ACQP2U_43495 (plasmid) [Nocardia sp. CA-084685]|uniref:hypothetical protein n=1 Tax=Nocardia sp. CA-084685 TaxID=3239970 RepID=UPI003D98CFC7
MTKNNRSRIVRAHAQANGISYSRARHELDGQRTRYFDDQGVWHEIGDPTTASVIAIANTLADRLRRLWLTTDLSPAPTVVLGGLPYLVTQCTDNRRFHNAIEDAVEYLDELRNPERGDGDAAPDHRTGIAETFEDRIQQAQRRLSGAAAKRFAVELVHAQMLAAAARAAAQRSCLLAELSLSHPRTTCWHANPVRPRMAVYDTSSHGEVLRTITPRGCLRHAAEEYTARAVAEPGVRIQIEGGSCDDHQTVMDLSREILLHGHTHSPQMAAALHPHPARTPLPDPVAVRWFTCPHCHGVGRFVRADGAATQCGYCTPTPAEVHRVAVDAAAIATAITTPGSSGCGFRVDPPPTFFEGGPYGAVTVWLYIRYFQALIPVPTTAEHHLGITNYLTDEDRDLIGHITEIAIALSARPATPRTPWPIVELHPELSQRQIAVARAFGPLFGSVLTLAKTLCEQAGHTDTPTQASVTAYLYRSLCGTTGFPPWTSIDFGNPDATAHATELAQRFAELLGEPDEFVIDFEHNLAARPTAQQAIGWLCDPTDPVRLVVSPSVTTPTGTPLADPYVYTGHGPTMTPTPPPTINSQPTQTNSTT